MAERRLEAIQTARRRADYEPLSDDDDAEIDSPQVDPFATSSTSPEASPLAHSSAQFDPLFRPHNETTPQSQPMQSTPLYSGIPKGRSLLDEMDDVSFELTPIFSGGESTNMNVAPTTSGVAGYLEIEEEPPRETFGNSHIESSSSQLDPVRGIDGEEPIRTSSGLLLTHRRTPPATRPPRRRFADEDDNKKYEIPFWRGPSTFRSFSPQTWSLGWSWKSPASNVGNSHFFPSTGSRHSMPMVQAKRFMAYVRLWVVASFVLLLVATSVLVHSFRHSNGTINDKNTGRLQQNEIDIPDQIILVPMDNVTEWASLRQQQHRTLQLGDHHHLVDNGQHSQGKHGVRRILLELRQEFEEWVQEHGKKYHSENEKEKRFHVWAHNHQRTTDKNERHGRCRLTKQHVFGSNAFKDLTHDEFKTQFLTGYKGPLTDDLERHHRERSLKMGSPGRVLRPEAGKVNMHPSVKQRLLGRKVPLLRYTDPSCRWYDVSCWLRWIWNNANFNFAGIRTMEPAYDADSYPTSIDWRTLGAVTDVRYQGVCGACWAITAVETVESAHFISTGTLYDLAESEIILCDKSCEMCEGGWPQNAFAWVMDHGGLPLQDSFSYDASFLYAMTAALDGTSEEYVKDDVSSYRSSLCPDGDDSSGSHSNDEEFDQDGKENDNYGDYSSSGRYGNIKGYGYATDRCVCYSDGSGCDCDNQNEGLAVRNVATYGPAVVCLEASLWQDYSGGIMTSDIGCSSAFLDMNHCVQVVGYAYMDGSDEDEEGSNSRSGDSGSGSRDDNHERDGYWIVRNQWGNSWGMNGYAYVSMGDNTCGILNDMAQAYL